MGNATNHGRTALLLCFCTMPSFAHHGVAPHYDTSKPVSLDGIIAKFDFINPHSFVHIQTVDETGVKQVWECELASRSVLTRNGLSADLFKVGERIKLDGVAGRQNPLGCAFRVAYFSDGSVLRSTTLFGPTLAPVAEAPAEPNSVIGIWTMKRFSVSTYEGALTEAGERARAAFDPITDDPAIYCDPVSPVRSWVNVNEPFEIRRDDDTVVIDHRFMDSQRIVHLTAEGPPQSIPRSTMGYSTGRFDSEALIVATSRFSAAPLEPRSAVMHTQDLELTEKLEVNRDTGELEITWVIADPAYFAAPVTQTEYFVRSQRDSEPYDCQPGYQQ
jgi:hypothetical protein